MIIFLIYDTNNTFEVRLSYLVNLIVKVFNSLFSYNGWVTCVVYVIKIKTIKRHKNESVTRDPNL